jgi:histidine phosphotransfer protein HptB
MDADSRDIAGNAPIDQNTIQDLRNEGDNLLRDLVDMFIREVPDQLATLEAALAKGDAGATRLTAHTFKGTGVNFGASQMQALASAIEEKGRNGLLEGASATFVELRAECARVRDALKAVR